MEKMSQFLNMTESQFIVIEFQSLQSVKSYVNVCKNINSSYCLLTHLAKYDDNIVSFNYTVGQAFPWAFPRAVVHFNVYATWKSQKSDVNIASQSQVFFFLCQSRYLYIYFFFVSHDISLMPRLIRSLWLWDFSLKRK